MILKLERLEAIELQGIARDVLSEQNYLNVLNTFDSSKMNICAQINHTLMKLEASIKGNHYNADIKKHLEETVKELQAVKSNFNINDCVLNCLIPFIKKDIEKFETMVQMTDDFSESYRNNISKRADALKNILAKVGVQ